MIALHESPEADPYPACPKCGGQYLREDTRCHCYQCCFEWDLRAPVREVRRRARRRVRGARPLHPLLDQGEIAVPILDEDSMGHAAGVPRDAS